MTEQGNSLFFPLPGESENKVYTKYERFIAIGQGHVTSLPWLLSVDCLFKCKLKCASFNYCCLMTKRFLISFKNYFSQLSVIMKLNRTAIMPTYKSFLRHDYLTHFFFFYFLISNLITTCLTYEELLPFIIDPGWMRMRKVCFTTCLIAFFVILIAACISSFMSMSGMSCVSSVRVDNASTGQTNVTNVDVTSGIFSIVLNSVNGTITT